METAIVLFGAYYLVWSYRCRAAIRFSEGQTDAYGRALCRMAARKAAAHKERSEPHGHTRAADEPQLVSWAQAGSFSEHERTEVDSSKEVIA